MTEHLASLIGKTSVGADAVNRAMVPAKAMADAVDEAMAPFRAVAEAVNEAFAPISTFQSALATVLEEHRRQAESIRRAMAPVIEALERAEKARPGVTRYLVERGWYITYEFPEGLFIHFERLTQAGDREAVDRVMCEEVRSRLPQVERGLCARFPDRAVILTDAFDTHRARKYTLSVPTFLAQSDGIGCEVLGVPRQFFQVKNRKDALVKKLGQFSFMGRPYSLRGVRGQMLEPLQWELSLGAATEQRDKRQTTQPWFGPLNRHGVQHGVDLDYPTEANSLRCVCLLEYLLEVDRILQTKIPEEMAELNARWQEAQEEETDRAEHGS